MSILIIAEAGVNHNGSLAMAKQLAGVAKAAGADIVKFQTAKPELVISRLPKRRNIRRPRRVKQKASWRCANASTSRLTSTRS